MRVSQNPILCLFFFIITIVPAVFVLFTILWLPYAPLPLREKFWVGSRHRRTTQMFAENSKRAEKNNEMFRSRGDSGAMTQTAGNVSVVWTRVSISKRDMSHKRISLLHLRNIFFSFFVYRIRYDGHPVTVCTLSQDVRNVILNLKAINNIIIVSRQPPAFCARADLGSRRAR